MRSIKKLLVANRGEIALRVMRTAHRMGIDTVAIYSQADADALHVAAAGQAVSVGAAPPADSYLNIESILRAAQLTGADAVHPGYGFLSENADFSEACLAAGLIFVGPSAHAIRSMGDKAQAKILMRAAGLSCIPGYDGEKQDPGTLAAESARIGYPVMIKASAGGGGRGMRIVKSAGDLDRLLESARSEARNAFGNDRMIVERIIGNARHIEIQILVDRFGNGVHFGERDCSVQRRHQKVIEEATAPGISIALRNRMGEAAVAAAVKLGYEGVGTFEFLLEPSGEFYFMEMNTRLQVEHPVTEAVARVDLVEWQLRVAKGEPLEFAQSDIQLTGHSIEVRLCAEDEDKGFLPQSGKIDLWQPPPGVRVEHAVATGSVISPFYDSMFAKLIATGRDREQARRTLVSALRDTVVFGIKTNRQMLIRCLEHPAFIKGGVDTHFLQDHHDALSSTGIRNGSPAFTLALALAALALCGGAPASGARASTLYLMDDASVTHDVKLTPVSQGAVRVQAGGQSIDLAIRGFSNYQMSFVFDGVDSKATWHVVDDRVHVQWEDNCWSFTDATYAPAAIAGETASDGRVRALSNGRVVALLVKVGDSVRDGDALLTIEAMKMEHTHTAPACAVVKNIMVGAGDIVVSGKVLIELEFER